MKKPFVIILLLFIMLTSVGCYSSNDPKLEINQIESLTFEIGDEIPLTNVYCKNETDIIAQYKDKIYAYKTGEVVVKSDQGKFYITIKESDPVLSVQSKQLLSVGEETVIQSIIVPTTKNQKVTYKSSDEDIIKVTDDGIVKAISSGVARVEVISEQYNLIKELTYVVLDSDEVYYEVIVNTILNQNNINLGEDYNKILEGIINYNTMSLVGVSSYSYFNNEFLNEDFGSGIIYKMNINYLNGSKKLDVKTIQNEQNIKNFEYYVITNRHLILNKNRIKIFLGSQYDEIDAEIIEYDEKIDLAVIKFTSKYYLPVAKLGNSEEVDKGEFIISIGNGTGKDYFRSNTFGIVSSIKRYVSTDTDGDNVNDWDSEYIQHDASINEADSGGAIMNLKGEIIGINSTKISSTTFNNMSFAIPINLVLEIVSQLEQGIRPKRATLGVQILDVTGYWQDPDYYKLMYPGINIPEDVKYGFYVNVVDRGGVAEKAQVKVGDIIVGFNNVDLKYSYQIRAELGKFLIGSGEVAEMKVIRDGKVVILSVKF